MQHWQCQGHLDTESLIIVQVPISCLMWEHRLPLILQEIRAADADIICLQELNHFGAYVGTPWTSSWAPVHDCAAQQLVGNSTDCELLLYIRLPWQQWLSDSTQL